jgi:hypothetical protein
MKIVAALCLIFAVAQAAHQTYWYAGSVNTTGTPTAYAVDLSVTPGCGRLATLTGYRNFTLNVTTNGFFYFTALFEKVFKSSAQIQLYSTSYNPADSCANLVFAAAGQGNVPHVEFLQYLTVGVYQVVITGSSATNLGLFAIHVDVATLNGATNELTGHWWTTPSSQSSGSRTTCSDGSYTTPYTYFSFYQNGTTVTDILVFSYNSTVTSSYSISAALYNTATLNFTNSGNQTDPVSGCTTPYFVYGFGSSFSDLSFNLQNTGGKYAAAAALGLTLMNGTTYSIVVGTYDYYTYTANFGVFMRATYLGRLSNQTLVDIPYIGAYATTTDCTPSTTDSYVGINPFTAQYNAYILDNPQSGFFDAAGCLYFGLNLGNATSGPINCPGNTSLISFVQCGDTGDGGPVSNFLIPGYNYTWLQFTFQSSGTAGNRYLLYNYSGKLLGTAPITTTAPLTTAAVTTAPAEMSSSSASTVVVMLALTIAAMFF